TAGVLLAVVAALTLLYRNLVFDSLLESETQANVALAKTVGNALWPTYAAFIVGADALPREELAAREELARLDQELRRLTSGLPVVKVKIYDADGLTVFSTDRRQIGEDKSANPGLRRAIGGDTTSELTYRDRFDSWEGELAERDILATYTPMHT